MPRGVTGNTGGFEPPDSGSSPGEAVFYGRIEGPGRSETRFEKVVADAIQKAEDGGMELHQMVFLRLLPGNSGDTEAQVALVFQRPTSELKERESRMEPEHG